MNKVSFLKKSVLLPIAGTAVAALSVAISCSTFRPMDVNVGKGTEPAVIDGQMVVKFDSGVSEVEVAKVLSGFAKFDVVDKEDNVYLVKDAGLSGKEVAVAKNMESQKGVLFAEPNFRVHVGANTMPRDPKWLSLWAMKNYGQDAPDGVEGVEGADIGALEAWSTTKGDRKIVVAIVDTGIDYTHPDLAANIWVNQKEKDGVPGVDDDGNGYVDDLHGWDSVSDGRDRVYFGKVGDADPMDDGGHGTHVAGTIGAVGGNGIGVAGVNWQVSLMASKFLDDNGSGSSIDEYRALKYVLANDVDVVNGSYGGGAESKLIKSTLQEGEKKGILFVFAAGNDSSNTDVSPSFPAGYGLPNIISVAATDSRDNIADFSNFGQKTVDIAAPGVGILSTIPTTMTPADQEPYAVYSGTSMASPHVAGAAALVLAADPTLRKKPVELKKRLLATAEYKPNLTSMVASAGRLSIARAVANQTSGNPSYAGPWTEMPYSVETPHFSQEKMDESWKIHVPGAKAIRVHISTAQVESDFDAAGLFDSRFRKVYSIAGELSDAWSPIIDGDTVYLKFSNSLVSIDDGTPFANFNSEGVQIDKISVLQ